MTRHAALNHVQDRQEKRLESSERGEAQVKTAHAR